MKEGDTETNSDCLHYIYTQSAPMYNTVSVYMENIDIELIPLHYVSPSNWNVKSAGSYFSLFLVKTYYF